MILFAPPKSNIILVWTIIKQQYFCGGKFWLDVLTKPTKRGHMLQINPLNIIRKNCRKLKVLSDKIIWCNEIKIVVSSFFERMQTNV